MSTASLIRPGLTTAIVGHLPAIKLRLRKKVPQLTFQDVRRARIPFYEALASELYESGCTNAAFLLLQLIEFEHDHVPLTSEPAVEEKRLKNAKNLLNFLFKSLQVAEGHKNGQRYENEIEHLLMIARSFQDDAHKRWIARQFFLICLDRCEDCDLGGTRVEALAKYYYGIFLAADENFDEAVGMLESVKDRASEQNWPLEQGKVTVGTQLLINEVQNQLYSVYSKMCARFRKIDSDKYEHFMRLSHKAAVDSNLEHVLCDSYLEMGDFLLEQGEHQEALNCYKQSLKRSKSIYAADKVCKTYIRMAAAYRGLKELKECEFLLKMVDKLTTEDRKSECYAQKQLLTGEVNFEHGQLSEAMDAFHEARDIYKYRKQEDKMIQACCFGALACGEKYFDQYASLVKKADHKGPVSENESLFQLLRWNVDGDPFW